MNGDYCNSEYFQNSEIYCHDIKSETEKYISNNSNPFNNPTEYPEFNGNYSDITQGEIQLEPDLLEYRKLKRFYSIGGWSILGQFLISNFLGTVIIYIIKKILFSMNNGADSNLISDYMSSSSIIAGINMLIYLISNVGFAFLGMKMSKISKSHLVHTRDFSFSKALQYCMSGFFLWMVSSLLSSGINDIFTHYGYSTYVMDMDGVAITGTGMVVMTFYTCIIAPLTEEIFFRGMLLRVFSKANQRFAIFITAFFFGLSHHNIPQFILAFLVGIFLAHITIKHNSIIPSIIVHMFLNSISTAFSYIEEDYGYTITAILMFSMMIMGLFMFAIFREKDKIPATTPQQSRRGICIAKKSVMFNTAIIIQVIYTFILIFM